MAITNGYTTLEDFKRWVDPSGELFSPNARDDSVIEKCIEAASRKIDELVQSSFYARSETRFYNRPSSRELMLDADLLSITTLTNGDGTEISSSEYFFEPRNGRYYFKIVLKQSSSVAWEDDSDGNSERVISVAGTWGRAASAPADIVEACKLLAHAAYQKRSGQSVEGIAHVTAAGVVISPKEIPETAMMIIERHRPIGVLY